MLCRTCGSVVLAGHEKGLRQATARASVKPLRRLVHAAAPAACHRLRQSAAWGSFCSLMQPGQQACSALPHRSWAWHLRLTLTGLSSSSGSRQASLHTHSPAGRAQQMAPCSRPTKWSSSSMHRCSLARGLAQQAHLAWQLSRRACVRTVCWCRHSRCRRCRTCCRCSSRCSHSLLLPCQPVRTISISSSSSANQARA